MILLRRQVNPQPQFVTIQTGNILRHLSRRRGLLRTVWGDYMSAEAAAIIAALIGAAATAIPWAADKFDLISRLSKTRFNVSGKWIGISEFLNTGVSPQVNDEHFFKVEAEFKQRGRKITMTEKITAIYTKEGRPIPFSSSREFSGKGDLIDEVNITLILTEVSGLTCGTAYLVLDTWGNELKGLLAVRNIDGNPVLVRIHLVRSGRQLPTIEELVAQNLAAAEQRQLPA
jgi:hypothetical protein